MPKTSIGTWAFGAYSEDPLEFETVLDRVVELGFDGVDFGAFPPHPDPQSVAGPEARAALAEVFRARGLQVAAVAAPFGTEGFIRSDDASVYLSELSANLEFCREIGAKRLIVNTRDRPEAPSEVGLALASERLLRVWREGSRRAEAAGIQLSWEFEPCWAFNEPLQIIELAHELAGPSFGVLYDTAHAHTVSEIGARHVGGAKPLAGGQVELLERLTGTINHVHLFDSDGSIHGDANSSSRTTIHVPFGRGNVDFRSVIPALVRAGGLTEWWTVDLCFWPDPWAATEEAKAFVEELIGVYASEVA